MPRHTARRMLSGLLGSLVTVAVAACTAAEPSVPQPGSSSPHPAPSSGSPVGPPSEQPVSSSPESPPAEPVDLRKLAKSDHNVLDWNVTRPEPGAANHDSPCSERLGLKAGGSGERAKLLYFSCAELGQPDASPARVVPGDPTTEQLVELFMAGPDLAEVEAGFQPGPFGPDGPFVTEEVDGVLVIDFLVDLPSGFTDFAGAQLDLATTLRESAGVKAISVLQRHVPVCVVADLCG